MASYRLNASIVKGAGGGSVLLKAAYRAAQKLENERNGDVYDYRRKGGVAHTEIMLPKGSNPKLFDREYLWNTIEKYELGKRKDAQLAREVTISLPEELDEKERLALTREFVQDQFVSRGMAADIAIHTPQKDKGDDARNHHAHILLSMRSISSEGIHPVKTREWNSEQMLKRWRSEWSCIQNLYLERGEHKDRVDHRTLEAQKDDALKQGHRELAEVLDRPPEIHVGPEARQISRRGREVSSQDRTEIVYGRGRERTIRYSSFDRGNRAAYNGEIIKKNAERVRHITLHREQREARFHNYKHYYRQQQRRINEAIFEAKRKKMNEDEQQRLLKLLNRKKGHYNARLKMLETVLDQILRTMLMTQSYQDRLLNRHQRYQLKYLMQARRSELDRHHRGARQNLRRT